ncbi:hypothetical protein [Vannielia litorea]|uniref:Uncharacterized protein n=1 Tax=Vannielia litorea TaxID=1217970 RepID=A0A1N6E6K2_9RHOB|nr:hypothetical protein [Vannielia litorea]SIN78613.1 hypothetical protein SAMN05444002_0389 [Vannielia litorea]
MRLALPLLACMAAAPAAAQNVAILEALVAQLNAPASPEAQLGAYSACLLGNGDPEATAGFFRARGWEVFGDSEMGMVEMTPPEGPLFVTLYADGEICAVDNTAQGTAIGTVTLSAFLETVGADATPLEIEGCTGWTLGEGRAVGITSGGQDPVCHSESDNQVRFTFAPK